MSVFRLTRALPYFTAYLIHFYSSKTMGGIHKHEKYTSDSESASKNLPIKIIQNNFKSLLNLSITKNSLV